MFVRKPLQHATLLILCFTILPGRNGTSFAFPQTTDLVSEIKKIGGECQTDQSGAVVSMVLPKLTSAKAFRLLDAARGKLEQVEFDRCQLEFPLSKELPQFNKLGRIDIVDCSLSGSIPAENFPRLSKLRIDKSRATDFDFAGLQYLKLTYLRVRGSEKISDSDLSKIATITSLEDVQLFENSMLTDDGVAQLGKLPKLKYLKASDMKISGKAFKDFAPDNLIYLDIHNTKLDDASFEYIAKFKNLRVLAVNETDLSDSSYEHLDSFKQIEKLNLSDTKITDDGFNAIRSLPNLKGFEKGVSSENKEKNYFLIDLSK